jgi:glycerol-3-phosphate acyltransferase PlsY
MEILSKILYALLAFLAGSIPFGLIISKQYGINIKEVGSKNVGATNVMRSVGKIPGILTFLLDFIKGGIIVLISKYVGATIEEQAFYGFMTILGHCFSPFLGGKGGKGVSTGFSVFLFICPIQALYSLLVFIIIFAFSGIISLSSLTAVFFLHLLSLDINVQYQIQLYTFLTVVLIAFRHKDNILRLINGKEFRFKKIGL